MKKVIFNIIIYVFLIYALACVAYMTLPAEYQEMLPQFNWLTALVSGGSTAVLGGGGLAISAMSKKSKMEMIDKFSLVANNYITLEKKYDIIIEGQKNKEKRDIEIDRLLRRVEKLLEADLGAKLSNTLIDAKTKEMIEGVLNDKEG